MAKKDSKPKKKFVKPEKKDPIFVPISQDDYKPNKSNILKLELSILNSLKHIERLKQLRETTSKLKTELAKILSEVAKDYAALENSFPVITSHLEPIKREKIKQSNQNTEYNSIATSHSKSIDQELKFVQEKLRKLNV